MKLLYIETNKNGTKWVELTGVDNGTGVEFENNVFGITPEDIIIDCDGVPCTEGDNVTIAVRNSIA